MKQFLFALLLWTPATLFAQNADEYWDKWNKNYPEKNITEMLKQERYYADSVEKHPDIAPTYFRRSGYRFDARYLGKIRPIDPNVALSVKRVLKLTDKDPKKVDTLLDKEVLFKVGEDKIWMPIQPRILKALKKEAKTGEIVKLYCAYLNEHTMSNKLYNTFFISEFSK